MKRENNILLKEILQELSEEKKNFQDKINKNLNRISEIDAYLNSIYEKEDTDFKVFSPRSVENVYKEQIERGKAEKYSIENENQYQYRQINRLDRYLSNLQTVLEDEEIDSKDDVKPEILTGSADSNEPFNSDESGNDDMPAELMNFNGSGSTDKSADSEDLFRSFANLEVLDIQEKDRQRIARDLHDSSLQDLAHLIHVVELSSRYIDQDPVRAKLELISVTQGLKSVINDIRDTIFDLRPMTFDDLGFVGLLKDLTQKLQKQYKLPIAFEADEIVVENKTELITLYRVIKECCLNSMKHSGCTQLSLQVKNEKLGHGIFVRIQDNGSGFDVDTVLNSKRKHYGLKIMKERISLLGGSIGIKSIPQKGTDIEIHVPILNEEVKGV